MSSHFFVAIFCKTCYIVSAYRGLVTILVIWWIYQECTQLAILYICKLSITKFRWWKQGLKNSCLLLCQILLCIAWSYSQTARVSYRIQGGLWQTGVTHLDTLGLQWVTQDRYLIRMLRATFQNLCRKVNSVKCRACDKDLGVRFFKLPAALADIEDCFGAYTDKISRWASTLIGWREKIDTPHLKSLISFSVLQSTCIW